MPCITKRMSISAPMSGQPMNFKLATPYYTYYVKVGIPLGYTHTYIILVICGKSHI